jgi:hypothetical protein
MLFKTTNKDNTDTECRIIGARSKDSNADVASLVLENYDDDSKLTYRLAEVAARDHFGNAEKNGFGDLIFKTNSTGGNNKNAPTEKMCVSYNGNVGINTLQPMTKLDVNGDASLSNVICTQLFANRITANMYRITNSNEMHVI